MVFTYSQPIVPGRTGPLGSVTAAISATFEDGGEATWVTPPTCTLDFASNTCAAESPVPPLYLTMYLASGTGHCPDPAVLRGTDAGAPITIGDFYFAMEFGAPPAP